MQTPWPPLLPLQVMAAYLSATADGGAGPLPTPPEDGAALASEAEFVAATSALARGLSQFGLTMGARQGMVVVVMGVGGWVGGWVGVVGWVGGGGGWGGGGDAELGVQLQAAAEVIRSVDVLDMSLALACR